MPDWSEVRGQIQKAKQVHTIVRREYLQKLYELTGRNVIIYYSAWLQKPHLGRVPGVQLGLSDADKGGFMSAIFKMDRTKGLDLLLHTPGGDLAATESLVDYLHSMFGTNIRVFIPQLAMSAGTMIACAGREIVMGKHSSLGPIDPQLQNPQFGSMPAHGIIEEFEQAKREIAANPSSMAVWQPIIAKYSPTLIGECEKAIKWSTEIVSNWLERGMFAGDPDRKKKIKTIIGELGDHALTKAHARHISAEKARQIGLNIVDLEATPELQEAVLSIHHAATITFQETESFKLIENQEGKGLLQMAQMQIGIPPQKPAQPSANQQNPRPNQSPSPSTQPNQMPAVPPVQPGTLFNPGAPALTPLTPHPLPTITPLTTLPVLAPAPTPSPAANQVPHPTSVIAKEIQPKSAKHKTSKSAKRVRSGSKES